MRWCCGRKGRVSVASGGQAALAAWRAVRGDAPGALFCPVNKGGRVTVRAMTEQAVWGVIKKRGGQPALQHLSPHDLRRTFVSDLLDAGADVVAVQHLVGHANVSTTARYDRRGEAAKRRAAELLHVPFVVR